MHLHSQELVKELEAKTKRLRREIIKMIYTAGSGHPRGSLSATNIIIVLFFHQMRINPENPLWEDRDRFILSKGHAAPGLYAALAELRYLPKENLSILRQVRSILQGHPDRDTQTGTPRYEENSGDRYLNWFIESWLIHWYWNGTRRNTFQKGLSCVCSNW